MRRSEHASRSPARPVQFLQGDDLLVRGNLKYRIRGGVNNPASRPQMLGAEFVDYGGPARGDIADDSSSGSRREFGENLVRKSVGICWKRPRQVKPGNFPMSCCAVFSG